MLALGLCSLCRRECELTPKKGLLAAHHNREGNRCAGSGKAPLLPGGDNAAGTDRAGQPARTGADATAAPTSPTAPSAASQAVTPTDRYGSCPACGRADQVRKVSAVLAEQTGLTTGSSKSTSRYGTATGVHASRSTSALASQLGASFRPQNSLGKVCALAAWFGGFALAVYVLGRIAPGINTAVAGVILVVTASLGSMAAWSPFSARARARIRRAHNVAQVLRDCFYCSRDDLVFDPDGRASLTGTPAAVVARLRSHVRNG
jgi:hypothetical protein